MCAKEALREMLSIESNATANDRCNCMQLCTNIEYEFQIRSEPLEQDVLVIMKDFQNIYFDAI